MKPEALANETCSACRPDAPVVSDREAMDLKQSLPDWKLIEEDSIQKLTRVYSFDNFAQALAFTNQVGALAEQESHHPAIITEWGRVTVTWWTHKIKGLHRNDFICAAKTDQLISDNS